MYRNQRPVTYGTTEEFKEYFNSFNPPLPGELVYDNDERRLVIGDGTTPYSLLLGINEKIIDKSIMQTIGVTSIDMSAISDYEYVDEWSAVDKDISKIYYSKADFKYYYYKDNKWNSTYSPAEAGVKINAATITTAINTATGESSVELNADKINFISQKFEIYPSDGDGNKTSDIPNFAVDVKGNVSIKGELEFGSLLGNELYLDSNFFKNNNNNAWRSCGLGVNYDTSLSSNAFYNSENSAFLNIESYSNNNSSFNASQIQLVANNDKYYTNTKESVSNSISIISAKSTRSPANVPNGIYLSVNSLGTDSNPEGVIELYNKNSGNIILHNESGIYAIELNSFMDKECILNGTWSCSNPIGTWSDKNKKSRINYLDDIYSILFDNLKPVTYKYNNGNSGRLHTGFIAQQVKEALDIASIDTKDFAGLVIINKDKSDKEQLWLLRYEEFIALNTNEIQKLKRRVKELEDKLKEIN